MATGASRRASRRAPPSSAHRETKANASPGATSEVQRVAAVWAASGSAARHRLAAVLALMPADPRLSPPWPSEVRVGRETGEHDADQLGATTPPRCAPLPPQRPPSRPCRAAQQAAPLRVPWPAAPSWLGGARPTSAAWPPDGMCVSARINVGSSAGASVGTKLGSEEQVQAPRDEPTSWYDGRRGKRRQPTSA